MEIMKKLLIFFIISSIFFISNSYARDIRLTNPFIIDPFKIESNVITITRTDFCGHEYVVAHINSTKTGICVNFTGNKVYWAFNITGYRADNYLLGTSDGDFSEGYVLVGYNGRQWKIIVKDNYTDGVENASLRIVACVYGSPGNLNIYVNDNLLASESPSSFSTCDSPSISIKTYDIPASYFQFGTNEIVINTTTSTTSDYYKMPLPRSDATYYYGTGEEKICKKDAGETWSCDYSPTAFHYLLNITHTYPINISMDINEDNIIDWQYIGGLDGDTVYTGNLKPIFYPGITIIKPQNETYNSTVNGYIYPKVTIKYGSVSEFYGKMYFYMDNELIATLEGCDWVFYNESWNWYSYSCYEDGGSQNPLTVQLQGPIDEGTHNFTVFANLTYDKETYTTNSSSVIFTVDYSAPGIAFTTDPLYIWSDVPGNINITDINYTLRYDLTNFFFIQERESETSNISIYSNVTEYIIFDDNPDRLEIDSYADGFFLPNDTNAQIVTCFVNGTETNVLTFGNRKYCEYNLSLNRDECLLSPDCSASAQLNITWLKKPFSTQYFPHIILNSSVTVDEYVTAVYNFSVTNLDKYNYTFVKVYASVPLEAIYSNISKLEWIDNITAGETKNYTIYIKGIPVRETSWSINTGLNGSYLVNNFTSTLYVYDGNVSEKPIIYLIPTSRLNFWSNRTSQKIYVDGRDSGFNVSITDEYINITIPTTFSTSSLSEGEHEVVVTYYSPYAQEAASPGGGGGGFILPRLYYSPKKLFIPIYLPQTCNSTYVNLTWVANEDAQATIMISEDLKKVIEQPKDGERILLPKNKQIVLPIKACEKSLHQVLMLKGYSGSIEVVVTLKTGRVYSAKIPVEVRVYAPEVPPAPAPPPKPAIPENLRKAIVIGLIIAFAYIVWKYF